MNTNKMMNLIVLVFITAVVSGCAVTKGSPNCCLAQTKTVVIYEDHTIPANLGISTGIYTESDGYRYVNVVVEYQQDAAGEEPVSLGVIFAHNASGKWGSRRYFNFEQNFTGPADPQMITLSGKASWHGSQHKKSSYTARLPVMGPYVQVFPFNHHDQDRKISVALYFTD